MDAKEFIKKLKEIVAAIVGYFLIENGKNFFIWIIVAAGSYISSGVVSSAVSFLQLYKWPLFALFFSAAILAMHFVYSRIKANRPRFPRMDTDFCIIERNIYYEYTSPTTMLYKRRYILKAMRKGVDTYRDQFRWTGDGNLNVSSAIPEHDIRLTGHKNVWQLFEIHFPKALKKGEIITAEVMWNLEDLHHKAVPFFSVTVQEPTDKLRLELRLPKVLGVREAVCEHSANISAKLPFESDIKPLDSNGGLVWEIIKPGFLHYYEIRWKPV